MTAGDALYTEPFGLKLYRAASGAGGPLARARS